MPPKKQQQKQGAPAKVKADLVQLPRRTSCVPQRADVVSRSFSTCRRSASRIRTSRQKYSNKLSNCRIKLLNEARVKRTERRRRRRCALLSLVVCGAADRADDAHTAFATRPHWLPRRRGSKRRRKSECESSPVQVQLLTAFSPAELLHSSHRLTLSSQKSPSASTPRLSCAHSSKLGGARKVRRNLRRLPGL